jgi:hypothetical protein
LDSFESCPGAAAAAAILASAHNQRQQEEEEKKVLGNAHNSCLDCKPPRKQQKGKKIPTSSEILGYLLPTENNKFSQQLAAHQPKISIDLTKLIEPGCLSVSSLAFFRAQTPELAIIMYLPKP